MIDPNALLAGLTVASLTYGAATLTITGRRILASRKRVGGITFLRVGRWQVSLCKPRAVPADRMAQVTKRAQSHDQRRLDAIASRWCNG